MLDSFTGGPVFEQPAKDDQLDQTQTILQKMRSTCVAACYDGLGADKMESRDHHYICSLKDY